MVMWITNKKMFQFITVALEASLHSFIQRHCALVALVVEAIVEKDGKETRNLGMEK